MASVIWQIPRFRENYKPGECPKRADIAQVMRLFNGMRFGRGRDVRVTAAGLILPSAGSAVQQPWDIVAIDVDTGEVEFASGDVEIHGNGGTSYYAPSTLTVTLSNGENYVYAQIDPHAASPAVTLEKAASKPNSDSDTYKPLIWRIDYDSTAKSVTPITRYRDQNIEYVGWRK